MNKYLFSYIYDNTYQDTTTVLVNAKSPERALYLIYDYNGGRMANNVFEKIMNTETITIDEKIKLFEENARLKVTYFGIQYADGQFVNNLEITGD